jgi:hypothetical protein
MESQPSSNTGPGTQIADGPFSVESNDFRLAMTPTLKVLTEPTTTVTLISGDDTRQPVVSSVAATKESDAIAWTPQMISFSVHGNGVTTTAGVAERLPDLPVLTGINLAISVPAKSVTVPDEPDEPTATMISGRVEVSNGNGIGGFATLIGRHLKNEGVRVSRITNHSSYRVERSYIECRPDWNDAAQALRARLGPHVLLRQVDAQRPGTDMRVVLGRDSFVQIAKQPKPKSQEKQQPLLLTLLTM